MKTDNKKTGNRGEDLATEFLENKGYLILERNFRTRFGEIDIVCLDGEILVFVEVKTKKGHDFGEPEEMVNKSKLLQVQRMGEVFIEMNNSNFANLDLAASNFGAHLATDKHVHSCAPNLKTTTSSQKNIYRQKWNGRCRVDVVAIVLNEDSSVERISHFEAVY